MENSGDWFKHTHMPNTIDIAAGRDLYLWFIHNNKEVTWLQHYTSPLHKVPGKFDQIDANSQYVYALNRTTIAPFHLILYMEGENGVSFQGR